MLRLLTYNIWDGGGDRVEQLTSIIAAANPDVALLNEADEQVVADQLARDLAYDCLWARGSGTKHIALLTRLPVVRWRVHNRRPITQAVLEAEIAISSSESEKPKTVVLYGVHLLPYFMLLPYEVARWRTIRALLQHIHKTCAKPHILFGDFNATIHGERAETQVFPARILRQLWLQGKVQPRFALRQITRAGYIDCYRKLHPVNDGLTWMTWALSARLDYVFSDPVMAQCLKRCEVITTAPASTASDHFPLVADFET